MGDSVASEIGISSEIGIVSMQLQDTMLSEVSQAQKDKGCMFSPICGRYKR
jgi:hypothetical protein